MSKIKNALYLIGTLFVITSVHAQSNNPDAYALMTSQDFRNDALSNVTITNKTGAPVTVGGLFIATFDTTNTDDCSACYGSVTSGDNLGGAMVSPVRISANQTTPIGQNYLYNMIFNGIYYIRNTAGSSSCNLPGCSWPLDDSSLKWCVSINAASLDSGYTSNPTYKNGANPAAVPAYSEAGNSTAYNYQYDLIDPNTLGNGSACIGPITCNDKTLTCSTSTPQNESFQPYS